MKKKYVIVPFSVLMIFVLLFTACKSRDSGGTIETPSVTQKATRVYTDVDEQNAEAQTYVADSSWTDNYVLEYNYADTGTASHIKEIRIGNYYKALDTTSGYISFFEQVQGGIDEFVINTADNTAVHSFIADQSMSDLTTGWMRISSIDANYAESEDVQYEGVENVAGREADRYLQSVYTSDTLTAYAFVWIDKEYGFVSKCSVYTVTGSLYSSWELTSFSVGTVTEQDAYVDITAYSITEETTVA